MNRAWALAPCALVAFVAMTMGACGGKKALTGVDGGAPSASVSASAAPTETAAPQAPDAERDRAITRACTNKCERECESQEHSRMEFYQDKQAQIASSPFEVKIDRAWLKGSCAKGDVAEKRDDGDGITALVEGKITYKGDDELFAADLAGYFYLDIGDGRVASVIAVEKSYGGYYGGGPKPVTRLLRKARGADPWVKGQARDFHWESQAISEAFCDVKPKSVAALLELRTLGVRSTVHTYPIAQVPILWDEVAGMAIKEHVSIHKSEGTIDEAVDASYSRLDKVLVTYGTGKTDWIARTSLVQSGFFTRASAPTIPTTLDSAGWSVKIGKVAGVKDAGEYTPVGEDQFLVVVDVEITSKASDGKPTKARSFGFQLETTPGSWQSPTGKARGQLDGTADIGPGEKLSGILIFPRQRYERPFRLQVKTPDRTTLYADVFSYALSPEGWK